MVLAFRGFGSADLIGPRRQPTLEGHGHVAFCPEKGQLGSWFPAVSRWPCTWPCRADGHLRPGHGHLTMIATRMAQAADNAAYSLREGLYGVHTLNVSAQTGQMARWPLSLQTPLTRTPVKAGPPRRTADQHLTTEHPARRLGQSRQGDQDHRFPVSPVPRPSPDCREPDRAVRFGRRGLAVGQ